MAPGAAPGGSPVGLDGGDRLEKNGPEPVHCAPKRLNEHPENPWTEAPTFSQESGASKTAIHEGRLRMPKGRF